jgi:hypothetical protein
MFRCWSLDTKRLPERQGETVNGLLRGRAADKGVLQMALGKALKIKENAKKPTSVSRRYHVGIASVREIPAAGCVSDRGSCVFGKR